MAVREIRTGQHAEVSKSDQGANVKEENGTNMPQGSLTIEDIYR